MVLLLANLVEMVTLLDWPTGTVWNHNLVSLWANLMQYRLANEVVSPSQSGWPMGYLFVVPCNTGWPTNHCPHLNQIGQWGTYLWSHATPVGQQIIVPISIRLANGAPICGPIQHRLANEVVSPSQSGWPMGYLFVVPCNTGWPTNHCPHLNQVGQWGTYLWSHATANWLGITLDAKINTSLANVIGMGTMIYWPTSVAWDHK